MSLTNTASADLNSTNKNQVNKKVNLTDDTYRSSFLVNHKYKHQSNYVQCGKNILCGFDVCSMTSDIIQSSKDVHKASWVSKTIQNGKEI